MKRLLVGTILACAALGTYAAAQTGTLHLPNDWRIAPPGDVVGVTGTLPQGIVLSRDGTRAFVVDAGYAKPALRILDTKTLATTATVALKSAFGAPLRDVDGDGVWVAGGNADALFHIDTTVAKIDRTIDLGHDFFATSVVRSPDGTTLATTGELANRIAFVDEKSAAVTTWGTSHHPKSAVFSPDSAKAYVTAWSARSVDIAARDTGVKDIVTVGLHPAAIVSDGTSLYVADADDDDISVVDIATHKTTQRVPLGLGDRVGASPNNLTLDGDRLYVTCGAANAVVVMQTGGGALRPIGAIPSGWYPTAIAIDRANGVLYIANGKGEGGHANRAYQPNARIKGGEGRPGYVGSNLIGSIRRLAIPTDAQLVAGLQTVESLGAPFAHSNPAPSAIVRANGPIKHVIYIVKENRTYDQVFGDIKGADGDPSIVMFGEENTPNLHALVRRFGIFDRFFDNAHVSADGHNWSMAAFANDYLEKMWPANYAGRRKIYDFEDAADASIPHNGYLWDAAARAHVSFRNYGEFVGDPAIHGDDVTSEWPLLRDHTDVHFPTFDMSIRDVDRVAIWKREYDAFEQSKTLPQLSIVRLPRDHTAGTRVGEVTPQGMIADNDLAVGELVDIVSHSADWKSTAIFILEDDAQNGPDHVDEQRSTFLLISPYTMGGVQHLNYTTSSVLRTIETILGMKAMTPYDAGARPLDAAFTNRPDLRPFSAVSARIDMQAKNVATAYRASDSAAFDFAREDQVPDDVLNDILWHAVKGVATKTPSYGAFRAHANSNALEHRADQSDHD